MRSNAWSAFCAAPQIPVLAPVLTLASDIECQVPNGPFPTHQYSFCKYITCGLRHERRDQFQQWRIWLTR